MNFFVNAEKKDCTASIAGKDIKTHKLEMRQQKKKKLRSDLHKQKKREKMKKQQFQCLPIVLAINFHHNHLHQPPEDADDCNEKAFCFWFGRILLF